MNLKIPNKKNYKNNDTYLNAVYKQNKQMIDDAYTGIKNKKEAFKRQIMSRMEQENSTIKSAIKKELHRDVYIPKAEKFKENAISGLKQFQEFKKFQRSLRDKSGRFVKFDKNNVKYEGENKYSYVDGFGNSFIIDFSNSPKQIKIYDLTGK